MSKTILVLGSTGKTGSRVYNRLQSKGADVCPGSRKSVIPFDWYHEETWPKVLDGITGVYITFQPDLAVPTSREIVTKFVQVAKHAGVKKLVLLSGRGEQEAIACEEVVIGSGLAWTILRASFFMQNFSEGFWVDGILSGEFVVPEVKTKEPFVDADDIADVALEVLPEDKHNGKIYELTGPQLLSFEDTITKISGALKTNIKLVEVSTDEYTRILNANNVPDDIIWLINYLFSEVLDGRNASVENDIEVVLQRKASSFDDYVVKTIQSGKWQNQ
jgi:uncharacterized protein YbjT (DUF2867 family)